MKRSVVTVPNSDLDLTPKIWLEFYGTVKHWQKQVWQSRTSTEMGIYTHRKRNSDGLTSAHLGNVEAMFLNFATSKDMDKLSSRAISFRCPSVGETSLNRKRATTPD